MNKSSNFQDIQGFLSIGYIYLVLLGIANETLYYNQIGIEILKYSTILDILISPISLITSKTVNLLVFVTLLLLIHNLPKYIAKNRDKNWIKKNFGIKENQSSQEIEGMYLKTFSVMFAMGLFGFFTGTGIGHGIKMAEKIENKEVKYEDQISFVNGDIEQVKILGTSSSFIFYLQNDGQEPMISPIQGVVKSVYEK